MKNLQFLTYHEKSAVQSAYDSDTTIEKLKKYCPNQSRYFRRKGLHLTLNPNYNELKNYLDSRAFRFMYLFSDINPLTCKFQIENGLINYEIKRNKFIFFLFLITIIFSLTSMYAQSFGLISIPQGSQKPSIYICLFFTGFVAFVLYLDKSKVEEDARYYKLALEHATSVDLFKSNKIT